MEANEMKYSSSSSSLNQKAFPFITPTMHTELIPNLPHNSNTKLPTDHHYTNNNLIFSNNNTLFSLTTTTNPNSSVQLPAVPGGSSTSFDHGDQIQVGLVNERRLRRMLSNRESARRSRLRKKKQIEELQFQVDHLRAANNHLSEKLIGLLESNHEILQENAQLKEKASSLQIIVTDLISSPFRNNNNLSTQDNNYVLDHPKIATPSRSSRPIM